MGDFETEEARVRKFQEDTRKIGFENWLKQDTTRFMISLIPKPDNDETLITLLRSCYDSGYGCGSGAFAVDILTRMIDKKTGPFK